MEFIHFNPFKIFELFPKNLWSNNASGEKCLTSCMAIESYLGTQGMSGGDSEATWSAQCPVLRTVEREDVERCDAIKFKWLYTEKHIVDGVQQLEWWQIHDILTRVLEAKARVVVNHGQSWIRTLDIFRATSECRIAKLLRIAHVASLLVDVQSKNDCRLPRFRWIVMFWAMGGATLQPC